MPTSNEVIERLSKVDTHLDVLTEQVHYQFTELDSELTERFSHLDKAIERLNQLLTGNGTPEKGLVVRMDRLEVSETRRSRLVWAAVTAAITAVVASVAKAFH